MQSAFTYTAADAAAACTWTTFQLRSWGVTSPAIHQWLAEATLRLPTGGTGRVVLNYERHEQLLSLDVFSGGVHVYGIDRLLCSEAAGGGAPTVPLQPKPGRGGLASFRRQPSPLADEQGS